MRTPRKGTGPRPTRGPRCRTRTAIQQLSDDLANGGWHPFHAPCGILLDEADRPRSSCLRCDRCDGFPCLVHAKSDAEVIAVRPAARPAQRHPADTGRSDQAGDRRHGPHRQRRRRSPATASATVYRGDIVAVCAGAANSAKLLLNSASDAAPARAGERVGPGGTQLHVPQLPGRGRALEGDGTTRSSRRRWRSTTSTSGHRTTRGPSGNIQMIGKSNAEAMRGEEPDAHQARAGVESGRGRPACRRLLAHHRGPADARTTASPSTATATSTWPTRRPTTPRPTGCTRS